MKAGESSGTDIISNLVPSYSICEFQEWFVFECGLFEN